MYEFKEFYKQNRVYTICFVILTVVCCVACWLVYDYGRNRPVYQNTDGSVERLENKLSDIESRIDSLQRGIAENQKAVQRISDTINAGRENAETVAGGITEAERRLDNAIQASGRIQNLITDIENANR